MTLTQHVHRLCIDLFERIRSFPRKEGVPSELANNAAPMSPLCQGLPKPLYLCGIREGQHEQDPLGYFDWVGIRPKPLKYLE